MSYDLQSAKDHSHAGYLHLSVEQMCFVRRVLEAAGTLDRDVEWPEISGQFCNEARSPHPRRIPAFKLTSNEWWIFEAEECRWLADALENHGQSTQDLVATVERQDRELEEPADVLARFAMFCRKCESEDGFVVS